MSTPDEDIRHNLNIRHLAKDIFELFDSMNGKEVSEKEFADEITDTIREYLVGINGITVDVGTITGTPDYPAFMGFTFTGGGTISDIDMNGTECSSEIEEACDKMRSSRNGNPIFADGLSKGFVKLLNENPDLTPKTDIINCIVLGTAVSPPPASAPLIIPPGPPPYVTSKGSITALYVSFYAKILEVLLDMNLKSGETPREWNDRMGGDPNYYFSYFLAKAIVDEIMRISSTGLFTTKGEDWIKGVVGAGTFIKDDDEHDIPWDEYPHPILDDL